MSKIILASSSVYRKELLERLIPKFEIISPNVDESQIKGEDAKKGLTGWGLAGSVILLDLVYRMLTNDNFSPPLYFLISGALAVGFSFYGAIKS